MVNRQADINMKHQQQGIVLAVTLIMLLLITLLAVSGMRSTTLEERMASNSRNTNIAFQMAETALREGEQALQANPEALKIINGQTNTIAGIGCVVTKNSVDFTSPASWSGAGPCDIVGDAAQLGTRKLPQYYIEFLYAVAPVETGNGSSSSNCFYRITSHGYGPDVNSSVTLQSTYKFDSCI